MSQEKKHYYTFTFQHSDTVITVIVWSVTKNLTKRTIDQAILDSKFDDPKTVIIQNSMYLGYMTKEELLS